MKILLLDKSDGIRSAITSSLRNDYGTEDIAIEVPPDVGDAISRVRRSTYDIIISEYYHDGNVTGHDFLERVRIEKLAPWSTSFIILTTKEAKAKDVEKILGAGELHIDGYIYKPFTQDFISTRVVSTVRKKKFLKSIYDLIYNEVYDEAIVLCQNLRTELKLKIKGKDFLRDYTKDIIQLELICYLKIHDYESIKKLYKSIAEDETLKNITESGWFSYFYAKALYNLGNYSEARQMSEQIKEKYPKYLENYELLADIFHADRKDEEAIGILQEALGLSSNNMQRQKYLSEIALFSGNLNVAKETIGTIIKDGKNSCIHSIDDFAHLAHIEARMGNYDEALKVISAGVEKFSKQDENGESKFVCAVLESQIFAEQSQSEQKKALQAKEEGKDTLYEKHMTASQESQKLSAGAFDVAFGFYQNNPEMKISHHAQLYFGAECIEHGEKSLGEKLIIEGSQNFSRPDIVKKRLDEIVRTPENKASLQQMIDHQGKTIMEVVASKIQSRDRKGAISLALQVTYDEPNNSLGYFHLAKIKLRYMEQNIQNLSQDDHEFDIQIMDVLSIVDRGKEKISPESQEKSQKEIRIIELMLENVKKKISQYKEKYKKITPEMKTGDVGLDDILPGVVL